MNRFAQNHFGMVLRDFLDFHSAGRAGHKYRRANSAVNQNAQIQLALDVEPFFDQQAANDAALRARLRRDQLHSENALGMRRRFVGRFRELHAAAFAAPAGMNLRFHHHDRRAKPLRYRAGFVFFEDHLAARHWNAKFREDRFRLIFVNLHSCSIGFLKVALNSASIYVRKKLLSLLGTWTASKERHGS